MSTDTFKTAISAATYGKKFQTFDFQLKESDWLERYAAAMQDLAPRLVNEQDLKDCKERDDNSKTNYDFSALSEVLGRIESQISYTAMDFLSARTEKLYKSVTRIYEWSVTFFGVFTSSQTSPSIV